MHPLLLETEHRPIAMPSGAWSNQQTWHDLLFAHWPLSPETMRPLVPKELDLDLRDGNAYVAIAPFWMSGIRGRMAPPIPGLRKFCELNVRTYVRYRDVPGVYFFSLDAGSLPAVWSARGLYHLPYFHAAMSSKELGGNIHYFSHRHQTAAELRGHYRPIAPVQLRAQGSMEHWLTERYCLYTVANQYVYRCDIQHRRWPLQAAELELQSTTMALAAGIQLPDTNPLLHYAHKQEVLTWPLRRIC